RCLPIAVAVGGVGAGIGLATIAGHVLDVPDFSTVLGMMIGLGVGIDYALFIVTRYREALHRGLAPRDALTEAMGSAGRAVIFAGFTVVISMLGLLLVGIGWIGGMGIAISLTVLTTMISSVTLLPGLLGWAGERVQITRWRGLIAAGFAAVALLGLGIGLTAVALTGAAGMVSTFLVSLVVRGLRRLVPPRRAKPIRETWAYRWSRAIQRRPVVAALGATAVLLTLAAPVLDMKLGWTDESNFPAESHTRQAYELMAEGFGAGFNGPLVVTAVPDADASPAAAADSVTALQDALASADGVAAVAPAMADDPTDPQAWLLTVIPTTSPQDDATVDLVRDLRETAIPAAVDSGGATDIDVNITGLVATNIDITDYLAQRTPLFFGGVLTLSFLLLLMVFRSILVPVKAVIMNVLSIAASYGAVVAVFQWGWGGSVLGIEGGPVNPFVPMMMFAIVFGLSMDYEVFMLSRIREEYDRTGDAVTSVADGLANTARVITAAAAIMVVVFGSFMLEDLREVKLMGMGLALAVLLDATLVRMLLVPATMELLGARNWWMPAWLDRILPELRVEGHRPQPVRGLPDGPRAEPGLDADSGGQYPLPHPPAEPVGERVVV
ncbi:MAG: MMPL family transporter, partial [Acidimicrobiia bacterium]|nr:MMPL family transporter [Acidimicrobiia bacterium]